MYTLPKYLDTYFKKVYRKIEVVVNPAHNKGTLSALLHLVKINSFKDIIMSFADIYFFQNPFLGFEKVNMSANTLFVNKPRTISNLAKGGIVFTDIKKGSVKRIVYPPIHDNKEGYKWSGLTIFSDKTFGLLEKFLESHPKDKPEEDFIQYCLDNELKFAVKKCPQFVNVNNLDDIYRLVPRRIIELRRKNACTSIIELPARKKN